MTVRVCLFSAATMFMIGGIHQSFVPAAAETSTETTLEFIPNDANGGNPVIPGKGPDEKARIYPETTDGSYTNGALRIEHIPSIRFGQQKISSKIEYYQALWTMGTVGEEETKVKIPTFAQVTDERGIQSSWKLTVYQEKAFQNTKNEKNVLENTRIEIHEGQLFNTVEPDASVLVSGVLGLSPAKPVDIPVGAKGNALQVMATKEGKDTDGSKTSVVFASPTDYDNEATFYAKEKQETLLNDHGGLKLRTPGKDKKEKATYSANLVWTLTDSI
ncbi:WxL domain-containing protein [Candidatus Enterococcus mansonii]|uniref:WxL domain-containing protein n=1 Tax=Candidatus Enterococcus mansonii TaxID=1834181 RepID=A0A242CF86_9ENTE|nr:WxL domain-containing protein [Enterococcus sp. 4G2_DIV0659]OTO08442.1 hypothetical protein A5880_001442 [Enterococcus sp. 4G2_DIV0659]